MKRRKFVGSALATGTAITACASPKAMMMDGQTDKKEVTELRVYKLKFRSPRKRVEEYLSTALIPALNRLGSKAVGAFEELGKSDPARLYVLIPYPSIEDYLNSKSNLNADAEYLMATKASVMGLPSSNAPYDRFDSTLYASIPRLPNVVDEPSFGSLFEIRTYEGHNEDAVDRKVAMFNDEELDLFDKLKMNTPFFGKAIAGPNLPYLTYMLQFPDMAARDARWAEFIQHPDWKAMSGKEKYADTVSNIHKTFLTALPYSQI